VAWGSKRKNKEMKERIKGVSSTNGKGKEGEKGYAPWDRLETHSRNSNRGGRKRKPVKKIKREE